ncbi:MAG TPA: four helix bundle protein [Chryseolinea sp.]|nr:four helix bundle protein [Chryseolinea sp.]
MAFKFEKLKVWEKAVDLSGEISELVKTFPKDERATDSISLNIAEGSTGQSNLEFNKFLGYALRSAIEVVGCIHLAKKRNLIDQKTFDHFYNHLTELIKGIQALRNSIKINK